MSRVSLLLLATNLLLGGIWANSISRRLELQKKCWAIGEPDFHYRDSQFSFKWTVSDYIADSNAAYTVYDGAKCKEGNTDITNAMNNYHDINTGAFLQNLGLQPDSATPYNPNNPNRGEGFRDLRLFLDVQPTLANTDLLYYESPENKLRAVVDFCVRFSLYNIDHRQKDALEVNFQETIVTFYIDLTDGFQIEKVNVQSREKLEKTEYINCEIDAYECDINNKALDDPGFLRNQGSQTRVCVELAQSSKDQGLTLDRVLWFYFLRELPHEVKQWSIEMDSTEAPDQLTEYKCLRGEDICAFNTILRAEFYEREGLVRGIGLGLCMFSTGGSWLVEDRKRTVGPDLIWMHPVNNHTNSVNQVTIRGFPLGTTVEYTDLQGNILSTVVSNNTFKVQLGSGDPDSFSEEKEIRNAVNTLTLQAPPQSGDDFELDFVVKVGISLHRYPKPVTVYAVADPPGVSGPEYLVLHEDDAPVKLQILPTRSADDDNSETLSVEITLPSDKLGFIGRIVELKPSSTATMKATKGGATFLVESKGADPKTREANLVAYTSTSLAFEPRAKWAGAAQIIVEAVSTEANQVAESNSIAHETIGDFDTRTERAKIIIPVTVLPVVDLPYMTKTRSVVAENNRNTDVDENLVMQIGELMDVKVNDLDGSQTFQAMLTGFPTNAIDLHFGQSHTEVTASVNRTSGVVSIRSSNTEAALSVLKSLQITLFQDDDSNFLIEMTGRCTDTGGQNLVVEENFYLQHQVIVQAVADRPTLDAGTELKAAMAEGTSFTSYPVVVALNDKDGSETYESVNLTLWTATGITTRGLQPEVNFTILPAGLIVTRKPGNPAQVIIQGASGDVEVALKNLVIRPGYQNGEDINVNITVASLESNPHEQGPDEVAVLRVVSERKFLIPVNATIQGEPVLTLTVSSVSGNEDTTISLGSFAIRVSGTTDADGSEIGYLEVNAASFPLRTRFFVNDIEQLGTMLIDNWLQLNQTGSNSFSVRPPPDFSGEMNFAVRARVVDYTTTGNVEKVSASLPLKIQVFPVADGIVLPTATTIGIEDLGPVRFGNTLVNTKMAASDKGIGAGNNPEAETFQHISITVPQDTATMTYAMSGQYAPTAAGFSDGFGSAQVFFDQSARCYNISSKTITTAANITTLTQQQRLQSMTDILKTLETFQVEIGPNHTDKDGSITVSVTTLDVNLGCASSKKNDFVHNIKVQAVADTPSMTVTPIQPINEDTSLPLRIQAIPSADVDGSETTFVRIVVPLDANKQVPGKITGQTPAGVLLEEAIPNIYVITASGSTVDQRIALLNSFINNANGQGLTYNPTPHWSGKVTLTIQVVSMEAADGTDLAPNQYGGIDGDSKRETVTQYLDVIVNPVADTPSISFSSNSRGPEDTKIRVYVAVTTADTDGSESYVLRIDNNLPAGAKLFGANDKLLTVDSASGKFVVSPTDVSALSLLPPLHWSSALQGNITLTLTAVVTDQNIFGTTDVASTNADVPVVVVGVADKPTSRPIIVEAVEDEDYLIGKYIGNLDSGVLVDADGSETLSFMIGGFPSEVQVKVANSAGITYIGNGRYQVDKDSIPSLRVTPLVNFAGMNPYKGMFLRAVTQEIEGDQAVSEDWPITIKVRPVADTINWAMNVELTEADNEIRGVGVSFGAASNFTMNDNDGSESVQELYIDLSTFIADAKVGQRLKNLIGSSTLSNLVNSNLVEGPFTFNATNGVLTVAPSNARLVKLNASIFLDSNVDFSIPVSAKIVDSVTIDGAIITDSRVQDGTLVVKLTGTADVPTVFANASVTGSWKIPMTVGGHSTDTDVALGREASERIHYFVSAIDLGDITNFAFLDSSDSPVGFDGAENTWFLRKEDLDGAMASGGIFFSVSSNTSTTTARFNFTTVATENDGDVATNSVTFTVNYIYEPGAFDIPPLAPLVTIGTHVGKEDIDLPFDILVEKDPSDTTNPKLSVVFRADSIPKGASIQGALYPNLKTGHFVARAEDVATGKVLLRPPKDYGGTLSVRIEGLAVNGSFRYATSGLRTVNLYYDPVADGVTITLPDTISKENDQVSLAFTFHAKDIDGSETLGGMVYVKLCQRVSFVDVWEQVKSGDSDASFAGTSTIGYSRVSRTGAGALKIQPDLHWHGPCDIGVIALSIESNDDNDDDYLMASSQSFTLKVLAVPTPANLTAPAMVQVDENQYVGFPGLWADFVDKIPENGYETLSLFVTNVPEDSLFNFGTNVGGGVWSFNGPDDLKKLTYRPPLYFSGNLTLNFTAITQESSVLGQEAQVRKQTLVSVMPIASPFLMVAEDVQVAQGSLVNLKLNVRMEDNRTLPGETALESITLTFSSVPDKVVLLATAGGVINSAGNLAWVFRGTEAQSNALRLNVSSQVPAGLYDIGVSGITRDGSSVLATPRTDVFRLTVALAGTVRHLQVVTKFDNAFVEDLPPVQCADPIMVEGDHQSRITSEMFTLLNQLNSTLEFRFSPLFEDSDKLFGVMFPEAPIGMPSYPVLKKGDSPLTKSANCYANEVVLYIFAVSDRKDESTAVIPTTFDALEVGDQTSEFTEVFKVTLPCSRCIANAPPVETGRSLQQIAGGNGPQMHKKLAASMSKRLSQRRRNLEELSYGQGKIQLDINVAVPERSTGMKLAPISFLFASTIPLALFLLEHLL